MIVRIALFFSLLLCTHRAFSQRTTLIGTLKVVTKKDFKQPGNRADVVTNYTEVTLQTDSKIYHVLECNSKAMGVGLSSVELQSRQLSHLFDCYIKGANLNQMNGRNVSLEGEVTTAVPGWPNTLCICSAKLLDVVEKAMPTLNMASTNENVSSIDTFHNQELMDGSTFKFSLGFSKLSDGYYTRNMNGRFPVSHCNASANMKSENKFYYRLVTAEREDSINHVECLIKIESKYFTDSTDVGLSALNYYEYQWKVMKRIESPVDLEVLESLYSEILNQLVAKYGQPLSSTPSIKSKDAFKASAYFKNGGNLIANINYKKTKRNWLNGDIIYRGCK